MYKGRILIDADPEFKAWLENYISEHNRLGHRKTVKEATLDLALLLKNLRIEIRQNGGGHKEESALDRIHV